MTTTTLPPTGLLTRFRTPLRAAAARITLGALLLGVAAGPAAPPASAQQSPGRQPPASAQEPPQQPAAPGPRKTPEQELYEKSLRVAHEALEQYGGNEEGDDLARVAEIGYRVAHEAGYDEYPLTFHLIDMPEPNAFALPGGQLFITRGMLDMGLDDDMLAALLGHEIAHVVQDHHAKMQRRATLMNLLSQALLVGVLVGASQGDSRRNTGPYRSPEPYGTSRGGELVQGAAATSLIVNELLLRSFSREHEDEADEEGQRWAAAAGFDPAGAQKLMAHMGARLPQDEKYGYWRTHPFFDDRVRAARVRAELLKRQAPEEVADFRVRTQAALLALLPEVEEELRPLVEREALTAWPAGPAAEGVRRDRLHRTRDAEMLRPVLDRDYGAVIREYREQIGTIERLAGVEGSAAAEGSAADGPEDGAAGGAEVAAQGSGGSGGGSSVLAALMDELATLEAEVVALYPQARTIFAEGIYETAFLERFLSNWPEAPEAPRAALALGDAQSRLGRQAEAVESYLTAWEGAEGAPEGERAAAGLRNLAPYLDSLAALQRLAEQERDAELARVAGERLAEVAGSFERIEDGAEYLRRYPDGGQVEVVRERVDSLAEKLYAEVVVYQGLGDNVKAVERINKILTHAPLSRAAEELRERAVLDT